MDKDSRNCMAAITAVKIGITKHQLEVLENIYKMLGDKKIANKECDKMVKDILDKSSKFLKLDKEFDDTVRKGIK